MATCYDVGSTVFVKIIEYLLVSDILNLRLTCTFILNLTNCKQFFDKIKINLEKCSSNDSENLNTFFQTYGRYLKSSQIVIPNNAELNTILPCISTAQAVSVDIRYLPDICSVGQCIKKLQIKLNTVGVYSCNFKCLSKLNKLEELRMDCHDGEYTQIDKSSLFDVFTNSQTISKLFMQSIYIAGRNEKRHVDDELLTAELKEVIRGAHHIKEWTLRNIYSDKDYNFEPPITATSFNCKEARCFNMMNYTYSKLEKFVYVGTYFNQADFRFPNLRILDITCDYIENVVERLAVISSELQVLCLSHTKSLETLGTFFLCNLKTLILDTISGINDDILLWILSKCSSLIHLIIKNDGSFRCGKDFKVSNRCVRDILLSFPNLKVDFYGINTRTQLRLNNLDKVIQNCGSLQSLLFWLHIITRLCEILFKSCDGTSYCFRILKMIPPLPPRIETRGSMLS